MASPRSAAGTSLTRLPSMQDVAAADLLEAGDDAQQRGLAAAGGADEDDELAVRDVEVDAVDDVDGAEGLLDVDELQLSHGSTTRLFHPGIGDAGGDEALQEDEDERDRDQRHDRHRKQVVPLALSSPWKALRPICSV